MINPRIINQLFIFVLITFFNFHYSPKSFATSKSNLALEIRKSTTCNPTISGTHAICPPNTRTHTIAGTISPDNCGGRRINKIKVKYRNVTDNKSWNTRTYDYNGNWYVEVLDPNKEYSIEVYYKFGAFYEFAGQVSAWAGCNTTSFTLNGSNSNTIDICGNESIIMDGSASRDEVGYSIALREVNASGQGIGNEMFKDFSGIVPNNLDIRSIARANNFALEGGKKYYAKLVTKPVWREKVVILDFLPATVNFKPNGATLETGSSDRYSKCVEFNNSFSLQLNTEGSTCETQYFVEIYEVDASFNSIPSTVFSGWITPLSALPNRLDIKSLYYKFGHSFQLNKYYKIVVAVGMPWDAQAIYVKFLPFGNCLQQQQRPKLDPRINRL